MAVFLASLSGVGAWAAPTSSALILADASALERVGISALKTEPSLGISLAQVNEAQQEALTEDGHAHGKCGGFQFLTDVPAGQNFLTGSTNSKAERRLATLKAQAKRNARYAKSFALAKPIIQERAFIRDATKTVDVARIHDTITWLSSFETRFNKDATKGMLAINALADKIKGVISQTSWAKVDLISHQSTPQKSIRVHFEGSTRPQEIVVLGGHIDSINQRGRTSPAPGADDNASGSATCLNLCAF
ncbi:MAG: M28 family peptidase [Bdellovibrionales bacterium]|nr:M28 family peptidase [Bdellovibrionales bacterium]